ncbi:MAG: hypothetical protein V7641_3101 [Blastocatellia bacterium]
MEKIFHKTNASIWFGLAAGILYGALARIGFTYNRFKDSWSLMTLGFIFFVPLALGILTVYYGEKERKRSWPYRIFTPWVPCLILMLAAFLIGWEGSICILMALPIFLIMSSLGGVIAALIFQTKRHQQNNFPLVIFFAALPFVSASIENQFRLPQSVRMVETQITINASPQIAWRNIERVREIKQNEQKNSLFQLLGFPRPIEATLSHEGLGGVRHASFAGGVLFVETITKWEPEKELNFSIKADTASIPPTTLDEHVTVGGPYFDVLEGSYRIETLSNEQVVLRLSSKHRLSTRFNFYAGWWTDYIMRDIQENILGIIKDRCESQALKGETP